MSTHLKQLADRYLGYLLVGFFLPITRLLGLVMKRDHSLLKPPEVILFIKILGLGSLVASSDTIRIIKKKYPRAKCILLTDINIAKGIGPFQLFDEFWTIKSGNIFSVFFQSLKFILRSWQWKNLWVVDLEVYSKLTTVYALMTLALNRFGFYLGPVFFRKYLNTHNVHFNQSAFLSDNYLYMAEYITREELKQDVFVRSIRTNESSKKFIALNNTCSDLALVRKFPDNLFATICEWLLNNTAYHLAFLGSMKDKESICFFIDSNPVLTSLKDRIVVIAGKYEFESYYNFLAQECACLVTIDSGPLHIARALGLPTVSVWGPTNPANYLKVLPEEKNRHLYHYSEVHCSPCVHFVTKLPCGGNNFCMNKMEMNSVIEKIKKLLSDLKSAEEG